MADEKKIGMIGKYEIKQELAKGGMGVVFKAYHPALKIDVILKKLKIARNPTIRKRFEREAKILLGLQSPYIVHLHDYFIENNAHYIVEEFVDGMSLDKLIDKQGILTPPMAMVIFYDACQALRFAHKKGIVHRDIKPANILISKQAAVKLADFGIAATEKEEEVSSTSRADTNATVVSTGLTQAGTILGTPAYMPPEQFEDSSKVDKRADIYAMGIMLYEMLTGQKPYPGTLTMETMEKIKKGKYIKPQKLDKTLPRVITHLINKMLKPKQEKRMDSIEKVIKTVKKYLSRYDTHEIRVALAQAVSTSNTFAIPTFVPKPRTALHIALITLIIVVVAGLSHLGWETGFFHKTVLSHWYSPVEVTVHIPESATAGADLTAQSFFFENDNDKIPDVRGVHQVFKPLENPEGKNRVKTLYAKPIYLRHGEYRIKVVVGPCVWWKSFLVSNDTVSLEADFSNIAKRSITVHKSAIDAETGADISKKCKLFVLYSNKWTLLENVPKNALKIGQTWHFKASCSGYNDEVFGLTIDWFQDEIFINAKLKKQ